MPLFPFRRRSRDNQMEGSGSEHIAVEGTEKVERRKSKTEYLRRLLRRSSLSSDPMRKSNQPPSANALALPKIPTPSTSEPDSPMNKPLPAPPAASIPEETLPATKPESKISPITLPELHKLFSGAPQFFARSEGGHTGAPHPSVAFPWDESVKIRDLRDHIQIQHEAWSCVTAWPHISQQTSKDPVAVKETKRKQRAHFLPRCRERPNMLSMQGLERGTIGYAAALELGCADALKVPEQTPENTPLSISEQRRKFLGGKSGLRPLTDSALTEKLIEISNVYHDDPLKHQRPTLQLYTELFTQILFPPSKVTDSQDPYSLQVQIESLIEVLSESNVWVDFALVEWRIKLGQVLWGIADPESDEIQVNDGTFSEPGTERYWLLLQVLLSCELLLRLDAISISIEQGLSIPKPVELQRWESIATKSVRWNLILARVWLENIRLENRNAEPETEKKPAGWLATLTGATVIQPVVREGVENLHFHGRKQAQQLSGLVHFARKIHWLNLEALESKVLSNGISIADDIPSQVGTPMSLVTQRSSSYFSSQRPRPFRALSMHKNISAIIHPAGWLSNSYISGLILPGEGLSHFLISTLLENDPDTLSRLGEQANLYGGFIVGKRSFWSTACIVGRVLAARKGAADCMGWISSDVVPMGASEGWVDIEVDSFTKDGLTNEDKARLWNKTSIEHDSNVTGGAGTSSLLPADFSIPVDDSTQALLDITFQSLDFFSAVDSVHSTPTAERPSTLASDQSYDAPGIRTYSAVAKFLVGEEKQEINLGLNYDVQFVTAFPCIPNPQMEVLKEPSDQKRSPPTAKIGDSGLVSISGHPLHKAYEYTKISLVDLLNTDPSTQFEDLLEFPPETTQPPSSATPSTSSSTTLIPKVLIIDCTDISHSRSSQPSSIYVPTSSQTSFRQNPTVGVSPYAGGKRTWGSDLSMCVRALCAERGWNALVSRRGRGCISCAVREAGALGWRVIIRLA